MPCFLLEHITANSELLWLPTGVLTQSYLVWTFFTDAICVVPRTSLQNQPDLQSRRCLEVSHPEARSLPKQFLGGTNH